jgi:hypothetical protein
VRAEHRSALVPGELATSLHFLAGHAADPEVREAREPAAGAVLDQHDDEGAGAVAHPQDLVARVLVAAAVHHVHVGEPVVEVEAGIHVGDGERHVREPTVDAHPFAA